MALDRLNRLLGRRPLPPDLGAALAELGRLSRSRPELAGPAATLGGVLRAAYLAAPEPEAAAPDPDTALAGWARGEPAFRVDQPALDAGRLRRRGRAVCRSLRGVHPSATRLGRAIAFGRVDLPGWCRGTLEGRADQVEVDASPLGLDPALAGSVVRLALLPALAGRSAALDAIRPEGAWIRGDCPNCGGPALLAEARGLDRRRVLRCGVCAGGWAAERVRCPSCGEADHRALRYRFVEGDEDRLRLACCDGCGARLKVVSTLGPITAPGLLVAELAALPLELAEGVEG